MIPRAVPEPPLDVVSQGGDPLGDRPDAIQPQGMDRQDLDAGR